MGSPKKCTVLTNTNDEYEPNLACSKTGKYSETQGLSVDKPAYNLRGYCFTSTQNMKTGLFLCQYGLLGSSAKLADYDHCHFTRCPQFKYLS